MTDINRVFLVGRLTRDADLRFTNSGTPVGKFSVAVNRSRKNGDKWDEEVNYFDIVLWGKIAEALSKYLLKGKQIAVEGELRQNRWEQDGQSRSRVEIHASNIQLLGGSAGGGQSNSSYSPQGGSNSSQQGGGSNPPQQGNNYSRPQTPDSNQGGGSTPFEQYGQNSYNGNNDQFDDDGIPF